MKYVVEYRSLLKATHHLLVYNTEKDANTAADILDDAENGGHADDKVESLIAKALEKCVDTVDIDYRKSDYSMEINGEIYKNVEHPNFFDLLI